MKMFKYIVSFLLLFSLQQATSFAQLENFKSSSSLGFMLGGSYYIGDLNQFQHFHRIQPAGGLIYRYYINSRVELRGTISYGRVEGTDADYDDPLLNARNLSFRSDIFEFAGGIEFNFLNYKLGNPKYFFSPYLFIEMALFKMNPMTEYKGEWVQLQTIGTEGQNSNLTSKKAYPLVQLAIPFGVGFKINLGQKAALAFEYGIRKTFTDYLDDVGDGEYLDLAELAEQNGNIAAALSNKADGKYLMTGPRGNPSTKDWYSMFGVSLTFSLGKANTCFY